MHYVHISIQYIHFYYGLDCSNLSIAAGRDRAGFRLLSAVNYRVM